MTERTTLLAADAAEPALDRHMLAEDIPTTCAIADVCRILGIKKTTVYDRMKAGTFPIPEILPRVKGAPQFWGENVRAYLRGDLANGRAFRRVAGGRR